MKTTKKPDNFDKSVRLSRNEMKTVTGGTTSSCETGEYLYSCTATGQQHVSIKGVICAVSSYYADLEFQDVLVSQGVWGKNNAFDSITCIG